jgi:hypothetical protein
MNGACIKYFRKGNEIWQVELRIEFIGDGSYSRFREAIVDRREIPETLKRTPPDQIPNVFRQNTDVSIPPPRVVKGALLRYPEPLSCAMESPENKREKRTRN